MKKRVLAILLTVMMCLSLLSAMSLSAEEAGGDVAYPDWKGSGTEVDPWLIESAADLQKLADSINGNYSHTSDHGATLDNVTRQEYIYSGKYFKLMNDITGWDTVIGTMYDADVISEYFCSNHMGDNATMEISQQIGAGPDLETELAPFHLIWDDPDNKENGCGRYHTIWSYFDGIFDGNGKTITLAIDQPDKDYVGLFGYLGTHGVVKNLTVDGSVKGRSAVGGIAGTYTGMIENCRNKADVTGHDGVGGLAGTVSGENETTGGFVIEFLGKGSDLFDAPPTFSRCMLYECTNEGTVTGDDDVGGIVGRSFSMIMDCVNKGSVIRTADKIDWETDPGDYGRGGVGGIVATMDGGVSGCVNEGTVTDNAEGGKYVGGIAGNMYDRSSVSCSRNSGNIIATGTGSQYVGGIVGLLGELNCFIFNCANTGNITVGTGSSNIGGLAGWKKEESSCYNANPCSVGNSYNTGTITAGAGSSNIGGLVGSMYGTLVNCWQAGTISAEDCTSVGTLLGGKNDTEGSLALNCYYPEGTEACPAGALQPWADYSALSVEKFKGAAGTTDALVDSLNTFISSNRGTDNDGGRKNSSEFALWKVSASENGGYPDFDVKVVEVAEGRTKTFMTPLTKDSHPEKNFHNTVRNSYYLTEDVATEFILWEPSHLQLYLDGYTLTLNRVLQVETQGRADIFGNPETAAWYRYTGDGQPWEPQEGEPASGAGVEKATLAEFTREAALQALEDGREYYIRTAGGSIAFADSVSGNCGIQVGGVVNLNSVNMIGQTHNFGNVGAMLGVDMGHPDGSNTWRRGDAGNFPDFMHSTFGATGTLTCENCVFAGNQVDSGILMLYPNSERGWPFFAACYINDTDFIGNACSLQSTYSRTSYNYGYSGCEIRENVGNNLLPIVNQGDTYLRDCTVKNNVTDSFGAITLTQPGMQLVGNTQITGNYTSGGKPNDLCFQFEGSFQPQIGTFVPDEDTHFNIWFNKYPQPGESYLFFPGGTEDDLQYFTLESEILELRFGADGLSLYMPQTIEEIFVDNEGSGTEDDPYQLDNMEDLEKLSEMVSQYKEVPEHGVVPAFDTTGVYFELTEDIGTEEEPFTQPIGNMYVPFNGYFNGNGHTVTLDIETDEDVGGLFGQVGGAGVVENVITEGSVLGHVASANGYYGGIAGGLSGTVRNCVNHASVTADGEGSSVSVGGIVGIASEDAMIVNCYNTGEINSIWDAGGIVGYLHGENLDSIKIATVLNCYNVGPVAGAASIGGLVGYSDDHFSIQNCYSSAPVTKLDIPGFESDTFIGGLVGLIEDFENNTIESCFFNKDVEDIPEKAIGGINGDGDIPEAYLSEETCKSNADDGLCERLYQFVEEYTGDEVLEFWALDEDQNDGLPVFGSQLPKCNYLEKISEPTDGQFTLKLNGFEQGEFFFEAKDGGFVIYHQKPEGTAGSSNKGYLTAENGKLVYRYTDSGEVTDPTVWTYKNGAFSTTQRVKTTAPGFWFLFWYIPGSTRIVDTTYYLTTTKADAALGTRAVRAELFRSAIGDHKPGCVVCNRDGTHTYVCLNCGTAITEKCRYDKTSRLCICGAFNPKLNDVTVEAGEGSWKTVYGWFWTSYRVYTVNLTASSDTIRIRKIEYSMDNRNWQTGSTVTANAQISHFWIRVTDANGAFHCYEYDNGEIKGNPVNTVTVTLAGEDGYAPVPASLQVPVGTTYTYEFRFVELLLTFHLPDGDVTVGHEGSIGLPRGGYHWAWTDKAGNEIIQGTGTITEDTYFCCRTIPDN